MRQLQPVQCTLAGSCTLIALAAGPLAGQLTQPAAICDGRIITRVDVRPSPPPFSGAAAKWRALARAVGLHHATTRPEVVKAFLAVHPGHPCSERRRAESERILRAQPFLSDASVLVMPDGDSSVAVVVSTTDEVPVLLGGRFRGLAPEALSFGNQNLGGLAVRLEGRIERRRAYRIGIGGSLEQGALFGHPYRLRAEGDRYQVGHRLKTEVEHPFFTDLQRVSWHAGVEHREDYMRFARPTDDRIALIVHDVRWDVSGLWRAFGARTVGLLGGAATGVRFEPSSAAVILSDSGVTSDTGVVLRSRYASYRVVRLGITAGVRRLSFATVVGHDALVGAQDVPIGAMMGVFAAHSVPHLGDRDLFLSGAVYTGMARGNAVLAALAQAEGRRESASEIWDSVIGSMRAAFYWGEAPGAVLFVADEFSGGTRSRLPLQLTLADPVGGLAGYRRSTLAGSLRNVVRAEVRLSAASLLRHADIGVATFAQAGSLWAGSAPYGTNASRAAVGVSLLAAYPTRAKRLYRADVAFPLRRRGDAGGRFEVRLSSEDRTQSFWHEPVDVSRSRTGALPSSLFAWPTR